MKIINLTATVLIMMLVCSCNSKTETSSNQEITKLCDVKLNEP